MTTIIRRVVGSAFVMVHEKHKRSGVVSSPAYDWVLECGHAVRRPGPWKRNRPPNPPAKMRCRECEQIAGRYCEWFGYMARSVVRRQVLRRRGLPCED